MKFGKLAAAEQQKRGRSKFRGIALFLARAHRIRDIAISDLEPVLEGLLRFLEPRVSGQGQQPRRGGNPVATAPPSRRRYRTPRSRDRALSGRIGFCCCRSVPIASIWTGSYRGSDAILVGFLRWIEPHDGGTGVADPCRVFRGMGGRGNRGEQNDCRSADDRSRHSGGPILHLLSSLRFDAFDARGMPRRTVRVPPASHGRMVVAGRVGLRG